MTSKMEQQSASSYGSKRREETTTTTISDLNLREWSLRAQISRDNNTKSRRFSGSHIRSFREENNARSFRSCITISSTASSPGYPFKEEIDPSTYSFTTALKALQARAVYNNSWECLSPDGFALNSKWNEAEKYICNPLSGEVPLECLSSKTLSGRSFRNSTRITMSAPLVYHHQISNSMAIKPSNSMATLEDDDDDDDDDDEVVHFPNIQEKKMECVMNMTRDIGTQSTPPDFSSSSGSSSPSSPSMIEKSLKKCELATQGEDGHFPIFNPNLKPQEKVEEKQTKSKEKEEEKKEEEEEEEEEEKEERKWKCISNSRRRRNSMEGSGCLSWIITKKYHKHKPKTTPSNNSFFLSNFLHGCY